MTERGHWLAQGAPSLAALQQRRAAPLPAPCSSRLLPRPAESRRHQQQVRSPVVCSAASHQQVRYSRIIAERLCALPDFRHAHALHLDIVNSSACRSMWRRCRSVRRQLIGRQRLRSWIPSHHWRSWIMWVQERYEQHHLPPCDNWYRCAACQSYEA